MSTTVQIPPPQTKLDTLPIDQERGIQAMWAVIATEFMLFVCMFGAYYYLGSNKSRWGIEHAPKLLYPFLLLAILLASSFVLRWGEQRSRTEKYSQARIALWGTVALGLVFIALQAVEYISHLKELSPASDSYGSIFYAITTLHAAHVVVGLVMLMYVGILPRYAETRRSPHSAYRTVALYWHFIDVVWIFIVALLYVAPHFARHHAG